MELNPTIYHRWRRAQKSAFARAQQELARRKLKLDAFLEYEENPLLGGNPKL